MPNNRVPIRILKFDLREALEFLAHARARRRRRITLDQRAGICGGENALSPRPEGA